MSVSDDNSAPVYGLQETNADYGALKTIRRTVYLPVIVDIAVREQRNGESEADCYSYLHECAVRQAVDQFWSDYTLHLRQREIRDLVVVEDADETQGI